MTNPFAYAPFDPDDDETLRAACEYHEAQLTLVEMQSELQQKILGLYETRKARDWKGSPNNDEVALVSEIRELQGKIDRKSSKARRMQASVTGQEDAEAIVQANNKQLEEDAKKLSAEIEAQHQEIAAAIEHPPTNQPFVRMLEDHEIEPPKDTDVPLIEIGGVDPA